MLGSVVDLSIAWGKKMTPSVKKPAAKTVKKKAAKKPAAKKAAKKPVAKAKPKKK